MATEKPWKAQYASSSRSVCRGCSQKIDKGELRFGLMVLSSTFNGLTNTHWHHHSCFFQEPKRISSLDEVENFRSLRLEDQRRIQRYVEGKDPAATDGPAEEEDGGLASTEDPDEFEDTTVYAIQHSKSSRAVCRQCSEKIAKGAVRVSVTDSGSNFRIPTWRHVKCFLDSHWCSCWNRRPVDVERIPGFDELDAEGQKMVRKLKRKSGTDDEADGSDKKKLEVQSKAQD